MLSRNIGFSLAITFGALKEACGPGDRPARVGAGRTLPGDFTWDVAGAADDVGYNMYALSKLTL